jgi:serine/threonine-protein phosphatase 5
MCHAQMGNKGAYITFKGGDMVPAFTTYSQVPHPDVRPMAFAGGLMASLMGM